METVNLAVLDLDTDGLCGVSELGSLLTGCAGDCPRFVTGYVSPQVLHCCVNGSSTYTQQSHYVLSLADLSCSDYDPFLPLGHVWSSEPAQCPSSTDLGNLLTVAEGKGVAGPASVPGAISASKRASPCCTKQLLLKNRAQLALHEFQLPL